MNPFDALIQFADPEERERAEARRREHRKEQSERERAADAERAPRTPPKPTKPTKPRKPSKPWSEWTEEELQARRERFRQIALVQWSDPELRRAQSERVRKKLSTPEVRARISAGVKAAWVSNPDRPTTAGRKHTAEHRAINAAKAKASWQDPEVRARRLAGMVTAGKRRCKEK